MAGKYDLEHWILECLRAKGGSATLVESVGGSGKLTRMISGIQVICSSRGSMTYDGQRPACAKAASSVRQISHPRVFGNFGECTWEHTSDLTEQTEYGRGVGVAFLKKRDDIEQAKEFRR